MAILKVSRLGHPVLRRTAEPVPAAEISRPETQRFIDDMVDTMREYDGIGLAAPQVHVSKQITVIEGEMLKDDKDVPDICKTLLFLVNPVLKIKKEKRFSMWEGCLSVPGLRGKVPRIRELDV